MPALVLGSRAHGHLSHPRFLFVTRHKTATVFGRGHRSRNRNLLNLLGRFFHSPTSWKRSSNTPCFSSCFRSCLLILRYISRRLSRNETPLLQKSFGEFRGAGMAQWWERLPPTAVARVRYSDPASHVGWVCCWFSSLLRGFFSGFSGFPPSTKTNTKFQFDPEMRATGLSALLLSATLTK